MKLSQRPHLLKGCIDDFLTYDNDLVPWIGVGRVDVTDGNAIGLDWIGMLSTES